MKTVEFEEAEALMTAVALREYLADCGGGGYGGRSEKNDKLGCHATTKAMLTAIADRLSPEEAQ